MSDLRTERQSTQCLAIFAPTKERAWNFQSDCLENGIEAQTALFSQGWPWYVKDKILPFASCCVVLCPNGICRLSPEDYSNLDYAMREEDAVIIAVDYRDDSREYVVTADDGLRRPSDPLENAKRLNYDDENFWETFKEISWVKKAIQNDEDAIFNDFDKRVELAIPLLRDALGILQSDTSGIVRLSSFEAHTDEKIRQFIDDHVISKKFTNVFVNGLGMKFKRIKPGYFTMGNPLTNVDTIRIYGGDLKRYLDVNEWIADELAHEVKLTRTIFVATYLTQVSMFNDFVSSTGYVTTAEKKGSAWTLGRDNAALIEDVHGGAQTRQYDAVLLDRRGSGERVKSGWNERAGRNWRDPGFEQTGSHPVVCVSYDDAVAFIDWLNKNYSNDRFLLESLVGEDFAGAKRLLYRLLTEAEYEYVIRGGTQDVFFWGDSHREGYGYLNAADASLVDAGYIFESRFSHDDGFPYTSPVGRFRKNLYGIYDAVGNVLSWTSDWYAPDYGLSITERQMTSVDPAGPYAGECRVLRGASWCSPPIECRSSMRFLRRPEFCSDYVGFRVAFEIVDR